MAGQAACCGSSDSRNCGSISEAYMTEASYECELRAAVSAAEQAAAMLRPEFFRRGGAVGADAHAEMDIEAERLILDVLTEGFSRTRLPGRGTRRSAPARQRRATVGGGSERRNYCIFGGFPWIYGVDRTAGRWCSSARRCPRVLSADRRARCVHVGPRLWAAAAQRRSRCNGSGTAEPLSCGTALLTQYSDRNPTRGPVQ